MDPHKQPELVEVRYEDNQFLNQAVLVSPRDAAFLHVLIHIQQSLALLTERLERR